MKTELKDVIHLYLGCQVEYTLLGTTHHGRLTTISMLGKERQCGVLKGGMSVQRQVALENNYAIKDPNP